MKKIVIIDDNEAIQLALSTVFSKIFHLFDLQTYTSGNGVEGTGYIVTTKPDLIIVDLTLPEYSGKELIEFLISHENITGKRPHVIVLTENDSKHIDYLPDDFINITKSDKNFIDNIIAETAKILNIQLSNKISLKNKFLKYLSSKILHRSNNIDELNEKLEKKSILSKLIYLPFLLILQILLSIHIVLFFLFFGRLKKDNKININSTKDLQFRVHKYHAIALSIAFIAIIIIQGIFFIGGIASAFLVKDVKPALAASYTWDGGGDDITCGGNVGDGNKWSCALNWSGDIVPTAADTVTFNGTSTKDATVDSSFGGVITSINISAGYTGTITLQRSLQTTGTFTQASGTFNAANQTLDIDSTLTLSAGSFTASSGTTFIGGALTISGAPTFNANAGTVTFDGSIGGTMSCNNVTFNLVTFNNSASKSFPIGCNIPLGNNPVLTGSATVSIDGGTFSGTGKFTKTASTFGMSTATSQLIGFTQFQVNAISLSNNAVLDLSTYTSVIFTSTLFLTSGTLTVPTGTDFNLGISIAGGTFNAPSGNITLDGNLIVSGSGVFNANGGTVTFDGTQFSTATCNGINFSNVIISATGSAIKGFSGCPTIPLGNNPATTRISLVNSTISGTGTLTLAGGGDSTFSIGGNISGFTGVSAQGFTVSGANLNLSGLTTFTQGPAGNTVSMSSGSLALPAGADLNGNLTISGGSFTAPAGNLAIGGNLSITGSPLFNANGGNITMDGAGGSMTCNGVLFNLITLNFGGSSVKIINNGCNLPLGNNPTVSGGLNLSGILSGSGLITFGGSATTTFNTTGSLTGFNGLNFIAGQLVVAGANADFSSYSSFVAGNAVTLNSGNLNLPLGADLNSSLTITGGTFNAPSGNLFIATNFTVSGTPTFNANAGTIVFDGALSGTLSCNNVTFNLVSIAHTANTKTVNSNCYLPLGADPTLGSGASGTAVTLHGTLSGSGTLKIGVTNFHPGATLVGFTAIEGNRPFTNPLGTSTHLNVVGANLDLSSYTSVIINGRAAVSSGSIILPSNTNIRNDLIVSGGTLSANGLDLDAGLIISGGTFNAPAGNMTIGGNLNVTGTPIYNANGGIVTFDGLGATLTCNGILFNLVAFTHNPTAQKIVRDNCILPLGNNPTVTGLVQINGNAAALTGSGTLTFTSENGSALQLTNGQLSGFLGLVVMGSLVIDGSDLNLTAYSPVTVYGRGTDNSIRITAGSLTAPTGTMTLYDRIRRTGGTFNHNNGTVEFLSESGDTTIGIHDYSFTFYNLITNVLIPTDFVVSDGETLAVLNNFEMNGADNSNRLSLVSGNPGTQWNLDVSGATLLDLGYLNVTDSVSITRIIQTAGLNVSNGGNNINWNFGNPEISNIGPTNLINGSYINSSHPTFQFTIQDPDSANQVRYIIQVDNNSDFSSPEVNVTSAFVSQGAITFTPSSSLTDGSYYWKIQAEDEQSGLSAEYIANSGNIAFVIDSQKPIGNASITELNNNSNPFEVQLNINASDNLSGVNQMMISLDPTFNGATYEPYNPIIPLTLPAVNGLKTIYIKVNDHAGNESNVFTTNITIIVQIPDDGDDLQVPTPVPPVVSTPKPTDKPVTNPPVNNPPVTQPNPIKNTEQPEVTEDIEVADQIKLYTVEIKVVNKNNEPIQNATIKLNNSTVKTNKEGIAIFENITKGDYKLIAEYKNEKLENDLKVEGTEDKIVVKVIINNITETTSYNWIFILCCTILIILSLLILIIFVIKRKREEEVKEREFNT
jgi:CheY-like chemotaxis protein